MLETAVGGDGSDNIFFVWNEVKAKLRPYLFAPGCGPSIRQTGKGPFPCGGKAFNAAAESGHRRRLQLNK